MPIDPTLRNVGPNACAVVEAWLDANAADVHLRKLKLTVCADDAGTLDADYETPTHLVATQVRNKNDCLDITITNTRSQEVEKIGRGPCWSKRELTNRLEALALRLRDDASASNYRLERP